ncbi:MAG TPA: PHP domain-containing protein [Epulopiscium sp.]|nr:PHP domain-containing protein [Candidatus Epulonipiscium sp.]
MYIDTHLHESKYSPDSHQSLEEVIKMAKARKLDAVCVTNHDNSDLAKEIGWFSVIDGVKVIVGNEVYTKEGDILFFGKMDIPNRRIPFQELIEMTKDIPRGFIAAHPYRCNNRGMKDAMAEFAGDLSSIEGFNGSTSIEENMMAVREAIRLGVPINGAGDSHVVEQVGVYATEFDKEINSYEEFIEQLNLGRFKAVKYTNGKYEYISYT